MRGDVRVVPRRVAMPRRHRRRRVVRQQGPRPTAAVPRVVSDGKIRRPGDAAGRRRAPGDPVVRSGREPRAGRRGRARGRVGAVRDGRRRRGRFVVVVVREERSPQSDAARVGDDAPDAHVRGADRELHQREQIVRRGEAQERDGGRGDRRGGVAGAQRKVPRRERDAGISHLVVALVRSRDDLAGVESEGGDGAGDARRECEEMRRGEAERRRDGATRGVRRRRRRHRRGRLFAVAAASSGGRVGTETGI
mmetsp:Transcript_12924/g.46457  ORF Transcript_12924/g.46457 Transcript_12924/m.46457 type:complete len:251 (-) Transcript_12924:2591-3343(-)